jgi:hypothetical protein
MTDDSAAALVCLAGNGSLYKQIIEKCGDSNKYSKLEIATSFRSHSGSYIDAINEWADKAFGELRPW